MNIIDKLKKESGQAIVEFALIVPIFIILAFGLIDFSRLLYHNIIITNASKETLRLVSVGNDITSISNRLENIVEPITGSVTPSTVDDKDKDGKDCTKITLSSPPDSTIVAYITPTYTSTLNSGDEMTINVTYTYKFITLVSTIFNSGVNIEAKSYTRLESPPS
jgi:Flp pilus assembly protein TadG